jgi:hypothetical protein
VYSLGLLVLRGMEPSAEDFLHDRVPTVSRLPLPPVERILSGGLFIPVVGFSPSENSKKSCALRQFGLPAMRAVVIFKLPRPRPSRTETRPLATLRRLRTAILFRGDGRPTTRFETFVISFHAKVSGDLVEIKCSVRLSLK